MEFENDGLTLIQAGSWNKEKQQKLFSKKKLIICGLPRSGTTGVTSCLQKTGINFGHNLSNVKEDQLFRDALSKGMAEIEDYFARRETQKNESEFLGVKFPEAYLKIDTLSNLTNCLIIIVTRDPALIAKRNSISMLGSFQTFLDKSLREYQNLNKIVGQVTDLSTSKIIYLAYEKLLSSPQQLLSELYQVMESKQDKNTFCELAMQGIVLNSPGYLSESNLQPKYCIDNISSNAVSGWCFLQAAPNRKLKLKLKLGSSKLLREYEINLLRQDLLDKELHPTGICGFNIDLTSQELELLKNGNIKILIDDSNFSLQIPY